MNDDARKVAPSPLWVRVLRMTICFTLAAAIGWRGHMHEDPTHVSVMPFIMCELTAAVLCMLGLMNLDGSREAGPT